MTTEVKKFSELFYYVSKMRTVPIKDIVEFTLDPASKKPNAQPIDPNSG